MSPRPGISVAVAVDSDVDSDEIGDAVEDALKEVDHCRALDPSHVDRGNLINSDDRDRPIRWEVVE